MPLVRLCKLLANSADCNPGHRFLKLETVLINVRFAIKKAKLVIYYNKVALRIVEQLQALDLRKFENVRSKFSEVAVKYYSK